MSSFDDDYLAPPERHRWRILAWFAACAIAGALIGGMTAGYAPTPAVGLGNEVCTTKGC